MLVEWRGTPTTPGTYPAIVINPCRSYVAPGLTGTRAHATPYTNPQKFDVASVFESTICNYESLGQFPDTLALAACEHSWLRPRQAERAVPRVATERARRAA